MAGDFITVLWSLQRNRKSERETERDSTGNKSNYTQTHSIQARKSTKLSAIQAARNIHTQLE